MRQFLDGGDAAFAALEQRATGSCVVQALAVAREFPHPDARAFGIGVVASRFPAEHSARLMNESLDLVRRNVQEQTGIMLVLLALLRPGELAPMLDDAIKEMNRAAVSDGAKAGTRGIVQIATLLTTGKTASEIRTAVAEVIKSMGVAEHTSLIASLIVLVFSARLDDMDVDQLTTDILATIDELEDSEARALILCAIAPYMQVQHLWPCLKKLMALGATLPRPAVLGGLALSQGLIGEVFKRSEIGGNRISESPLSRAGGPVAVRETLEALHDVTSWWT